MSLLIILGQTIAIYVFLVVCLARIGRSHMAGTTPLGYLVIALLGSSVETGLYHGSSSLSAGLVSAITLIVMDHVTTLLMNRWPRLRRRLVGAPVILVHNRQIIESNLRGARLTEEDLQAAIRKRGYSSLEDVRLAVLEVDGSIGVIPAEQTQGEDSKQAGTSR